MHVQLNISYNPLTILHYISPYYPQNNMVRLRQRLIVWALFQNTKPAVKQWAWRFSRQPVKEGPNKHWQSLKVWVFVMGVFGNSWVTVCIAQNYPRKKIPRWGNRFDNNNMDTGSLAHLLNILHQQGEAVQFSVRKMSQKINFAL